jgi:hypothetical protein
VPGARRRTAGNGCAGRSTGSKSFEATEAEEIAQLKTDVEALVGGLRQSMTENRLLRQQLADRTGVIRTLPTQSRIAEGTTHPPPSDLMPSSDC